jgi:geranylgeranyl diphosphate synthase type 3
MTPLSLDLRGTGDEQKYVLWSDDNEEILLGPYKYIYGHPGKNIRAQLVGAFNMCLKVPAESVEVITTVVEMLHTASLL